MSDPTDLTQVEDPTMNAQDDKPDTFPGPGPSDCCVTALGGILGVAFVAICIVVGHHVYDAVEHTLTHHEWAMQEVMAWTSGWRRSVLWIALVECVSLLFIIRECRNAPTVED